MPAVTATREAALQGIAIRTNQLTKIQVRAASIELLVGGPYNDHPYGHTAVRVTTAAAEKVFDYGRYGRTWGVGNSEGEGVLNIWNSFDAYIADENSLGRVTTGFTYDTDEEGARKVLAFYEQRIAGRKIQVETKTKKSVIIDDYFALGPNCTTLSVAAVKTIFPDIDREWSKYQQGRGLSIVQKGLVSARGWPSFVFMPADLQAMLEGPGARKTKIVHTYGGKR